MRRVYLITLDIMLKGDRSLMVDVGPDFAVQTDAAGKITALTYSDPQGEVFNRLRYIDPAEIVAITASEYWTEDYEDEDDQGNDDEEPQPPHPSGMNPFAAVVTGEQSQEDDAVQSDVDVGAAVAEVQRIVGHAARE